MNPTQTQQRCAGTARRVRVRPGPWRIAVLLCALAVLPGMLTAATPDPPEKPGTAADCQSLLHQFDVAWSAHRDGAHATSAHHSRDLGEAECGQHQFTDGVRHLRRALHDIGVKPVKIVTVPAAH